MALPWKTVERVTTPDGVLELRQRGEHEFHITFGGLILMNSMARRSEEALGQLGCRKLGNHQAPRVLVGGLGLGFTLRAVLDALPRTAKVVVAELNRDVVRWCQGPLVPLTNGAVNDPRVKVEVKNVAKVIRAASEEGNARFDAIILDLYTGPDTSTNAATHPLYGSLAIERMRAALQPGGVLTVWGEAPDEGFIERLKRGGFAVRTERPGKGGLRHVVYVGERGSLPFRSAAPPSAKRKKQASAAPRPFGRRRR